MTDPIDIVGDAELRRQLLLFRTNYGSVIESPASAGSSAGSVFLRNHDVLELVGHGRYQLIR